MLKEERIVGPKTGKSNKYNGIHIPKNNKVPLETTISNRRLNKSNVHPRNRPSNPVVKGKNINSLGCMSDNNKAVSI